MAVTTRDGKTQTVLAEINMIPFIDVVLVLLIIFMITAPVIQSGLQVDVPKTESTKELSDDLLVVSIDKSETLYVQDKLVNYADVASLVQQKLPTLKNQSVYFRADGAVTWEIATRVIDKLTQGGIKTIVVVTQPLEGKP